jgi:hypothetical protein
MISIDICGNESLMKSLRFLIVIGILLFKKDLFKLMETRFRNIDQSIDKAKFNYLEILRVAMNNYQFGNEYHLLILSTVLSRNIYIYNYFTKKGKLILNNNISALELEDYFNDSKDKSSEIGHHLRYEPIENNIFCEKNIYQNNNLHGFFSASWKHYISLIPTNNSTITYKPK